MHPLTLRDGLCRSETLTPAVRLANLGRASARPAHTYLPEVSPRMEDQTSDLGRSLAPLSAVLAEWSPNLHNVEQAVSRDLLRSGRRGREVPAAGEQHCLGLPELAVHRRGLQEGHEQPLGGELLPVQRGCRGTW